MNAGETGSRPGARRRVAFVAGLVVLTGAAVLLLREPGWRAVLPVAQAPAPAPLASISPVAPAPVTAVPTAPVPATLAPAAAAARPSFDVVRVGPQGTAVIAGRAEAGAEVVIRDAGREIGRARADRSGSFVATPAAPLEAGGRALTLESQGSAGVALRGEGTVAVLVPPRGAAEAPVAVLLPPAGAAAAAPRVLAGERPAPGAVGLDTVDYDEAGAIRFAGRAQPGSALRVYVDNAPAGDAAAGADGSWTLTPSGAVAPGTHALRVDRIDGAGRVLARVELPFQRAAVLAGGAGARPAAAGDEQVVVQPGQNLWRLARAAYGSGVRYTAIFTANRDSIRDPRLIYPGQVFAVPAP